MKAGFEPAVQLVAAPDANRRAAEFPALYFSASPVRAGELQTLGGAGS
jgi:hypothetical protein